MAGRVAGGADLDAALDQPDRGRFAELVAAGNRFARRQRRHGRVDLFLRGGVGGHDGRRGVRPGRFRHRRFGGLLTGRHESGHGHKGDDGPAHPDHSDRFRSATIGTVRARAKAEPGRLFRVQASLYPPERIAVADVGAEEPALRKSLAKG
ncbi:hypothetical protein GCM10009116_20050 [Brevundimonas basaltis]